MKINTLPLEEFILDNKRVIIYNHNDDVIWLELTLEEEIEILECLNQNSLPWAQMDEHRNFVNIEHLRHICHDKDLPVTESLIHTIKNKLSKLIEN